MAWERRIRICPAFVALEDTYTTIRNRIWSSAWLPPVYQGTKMNVEGTPIFDVVRPKDITEEEQRSFLRLVNDLNRIQKRQKYSRDLDLEARIANYELAARMQLAATQVADLSKETEATKKLYGVDDPKTANFSTCCLMARRLVEHGVRFVTVVNGGWDHHIEHQGGSPRSLLSDRQGSRRTAGRYEIARIAGFHTRCVGRRVRTVADRGTSDARPGRDHNPHGFSIFMAGAGLKPGFDLGDTDELGYAALGTEKLTHSHVHATILHLMGLDFKKLTFEYEGRNESLIGVNPARVITEILA